MESGWKGFGRRELNLEDQDANTVARWLGWLYTGGYSTWDTRTPDVNERPPNSAKENAPEAAFLNHARKFVLAEVMLLRKLSDLALYKLHNILDRRTNISNPA